VEANTEKRLVVPDMKLSPNVGSDRSWVWNAAADVSEGEPEAQTLAIRFANSESESRKMLMIAQPSTNKTCQMPISSRRHSSRPSRRTRRFSASRSSRCCRIMTDWRIGRGTKVWIARIVNEDLGWHEMMVVEEITHTLHITR
jgi:hypothetical protein